MFALHSIIITDWTIFLPSYVSVNGTLARLEEYCSAQPKTRVLGNYGKVVFESNFLDQNHHFVHQKRPPQMRLLKSFPNMPSNLT
jgi:hypothetical protein